jgi:enamine deaminase RidA (YjgF/YER057c/UK114 family)
MIIEYITPTRLRPFSEQLNNCIDQLSDFINFGGERTHIVTQLSFFIVANNQEEYDLRSTQIRDMMSVKFGLEIPATSFVAQGSEKGYEVVLELVYTKASKNKNVSYKTISGLNYTVVEHNKYKEVHGAVRVGNGNYCAEASATKAFEQLEKILAEEGQNMGHIIRQWNYIEKIVQINKDDQSCQNYQDFNEVRSRFYSTANFDNGYPAATGIGANTGGVCISFIALSDSNQVRVKPIGNPRQTDAHKYSELVLKGKPQADTQTKSTPKFERANLISFENTDRIFVSGTASIVGEQTVHVNDVEKQTLATIENILELFSKENQESLDLDFDVDELSFSHLRVYVKYQKDIPRVKKICESKLNSSASIYLVANVCREELLVEIEGLFILSNDNSGDK